MNYSENTRKKQNAIKRQKWFRRMFTVALIMGILIGFVLGRISATAFVDKSTPAPEPTETAFVISTPEPVETMLAEEPADPEPEPVLLGNFRITAYCSCEKCCGEWAKNRPDGIVYGASGEELIAGVSCASPLPFGTVVEIEGLGEYIIQDRPAQWVIEKYGEQQIDIYFDNHEAACEFGLKYLNVYLKGETET